MIEFVGNDQVFLAEDGGNRAGVGGEAGLKNDAGFGALETRNLLLQIHVHFHGAGHGAHGSGAHAEFSRGFDGRAAQRFIRGKAQVIIGAEIDYFLAVHHGDGFLFAFENAKIEMEMLGFEFLHGVVQVIAIGSRVAVVYLPPP